MNEDRQKILKMVAEGKITVDEADELLNALGEQPDKIQSVQPEQQAKKSPKYLHVRVEPKSDNGKEKVNIRIPLGLIRAGVKLGTMMPEHVREKVTSELESKGINADGFKSGNVEELIETLTEIAIEVDDADERVLIKCE